MQVNNEGLEILWSKPQSPPPFPQQQDPSYWGNLSKINTAITLTCVLRQKKQTSWNLWDPNCYFRCGHGWDVEKKVFLRLPSESELVAYVLGSWKLIQTIKRFTFGQNKTSREWIKAPCVSNTHVTIIPVMGCTLCACWSHLAHLGYIWIRTCSTRTHTWCPSWSHQNVFWIQAANCWGLISASLGVKMICAMFAGGVESARPEERLVLTGPDWTKPSK